MKILQKIVSVVILSLIVIISGCACVEDDIAESSDSSCNISTNSENRLSDVSVNAAGTTVDESKPILSDSFCSDIIATSASEETAENTSESVDVIYQYAPPQVVLDTKFYCDDIEQKIELKWIGYDPNGYWYNDTSYYRVETTDAEFINELHCSFKEVIPSEIVDDMILYASETDSSDDLTVIGMGYMLYDMDSDGTQDYIVASGITHDGMYCDYLYKIYISKSDGRYKPIIWDCLRQFNSIQYILNTHTNGMKDIMVLHNKNFPIITYTGDDSYTPCKMIDERHTFLNYELLPNNILHINMNLSVGYDQGEYYIAIKFADNPYLKNDLLYTSYSDGKPRSYAFKAIGESEPTDFNPSIDGYDFYVELNENVTGEFERSLLTLLEIKYITAE